jgi:nucleoid DNA-binding protein|tara:strand:+ start:7709 stop:8791 length:1083 start_codon:yes stop_codon:yes gene_type:complete
MSRGNLQEMEASTTQVKDRVTAGAKPAEPMQKLQNDGSQLGNVDDLGGPTPENYKPDDDSAKLREPSLKTVNDVVTKGAKPAEPMKKVSKEEEEVTLEDDQEVVAESELEETTEVEETTEEEYDIEEDVNALLGGEELSEEFREKAKTIFEAAVTAKVSEIKKRLEEEQDIKIQEGLDEAKAQIQERVDSYLEYVSDEWMQENELAVEHGLKSEMTESFLSGMKDLFEAHYVSIPEDKYDVLHNMVEKLDEMETKLNEQIDKNISLNKRLAESVAEGIFDQVSEGLADTQKEKLASLAEGVEFESEVEYREKLETLKESYFPNKSTVVKTETLTESTEQVQPDMSGSMAAYLKTLSTFTK